MRCLECHTIKKGDNCQRCYKRVKKRVDPLSRALRRLGFRFLETRNALRRERDRYTELRADLAEILRTTGDYRLHASFQARLNRTEEGT